MSGYAVEVTATALMAISKHARYIAVDCQAPSEASRWIERLWEAVDSLEQWPRRSSLAEEDAYVDVEVRQLLVGMYLLLFTVDEERKTVWVIGLRHGHRRPRPEELGSGQ